MFARLGAAALLATALLTGSALADPTKTAKAAGKDASWLAIQTASHMQFDGKTLTLRNVNPSMILFTDRPARVAASIATVKYLKQWDRGGKGSFKTEPPNAGLTSLVDGKLHTASVELKEPRLKGTTLTYQVKVLEGQLPKAAGPSSLFIDGGFCCM